MKYVLSALVLLGVVVSVFSASAGGSQILAEGDKVRGDEGEGYVNQEGPCPFIG